MWDHSSGDFINKTIAYLMFDLQRNPATKEFFLSE